MMLEDQTMVVLATIKTTGGGDELARAPEAPGNQQPDSKTAKQTVAATVSSTSSSSSSSSYSWSSPTLTGSPTMMSSPDHNQRNALLTAAAATAAPVTLIKKENPSEGPSLDTKPDQKVEQVVADNNHNSEGLCLALSPEEEEDSRLKSSTSSNDDDDDYRQDRAEHNEAHNLEPAPRCIVRDTNNNENPPGGDQTIELRLLVRRREAGALIGKRGTNIKRLREKFRESMFSIPDTGNGPERVVCVATIERSMELILDDLTQLLVEKSPENDEQIELKLLIHSSQAGSIIGMGGQSIKKLRNDSKAAIKIYELCCPLSNERVCAIKARPPVVVNTIKLIQSILNENPIKGTVKPYDALHFDLMLAEKYGGFLPDDGPEPIGHHHHYTQPTHPIQPHHQNHRPARGPMAAYATRPYNHAAGLAAVFNHCPLWRSPGPFDYQHHHHPQNLLDEMNNDSVAHHLEQLESYRQQAAMDHQSIAAQLQQQHQQPAQNQLSDSSSSQLQPCNHLYSHNHCRGQLRSINQEPGMHCSDPRLAKLYSPSGSFAAAARPAAHHLFRYHPYATQLPPALPYLPACNIRPTSRHHLGHQQQQHIVGDQVYSPAGAVLYGAGHPSVQNNHRNEFNDRIPAPTNGSTHQPTAAATTTTTTTSRCRHLKPCSCTLVPLVEPTQPSGQQMTSASRTNVQFATDANKFINHPKRNPIVSANNTDNNIEKS